MKKWKMIYKKLLFPPTWLILILIIFSTASLITVFVKSWEETIISYIVYMLSAYTLTVLCIYLIKILPKQYKAIKKAVYINPLGKQYMTDANFRVTVSLYISLLINLAYSALKLTSGIIYSSLWLGAVAVYYILLSLLRFILLRYMKTGKGKQDILQEYKRYRLCGMIMLVLNLSLTGIVFQMVWQNKGYSYPGILIFVAATYTFYTVTVSIIDLIKYSKYKSPVLSAAKAIRFAAALVSLLSLETAMLVQFGDDENYRRLMTALTGSGVCIIVLGMSIYMISKSNKEIKNLKANS